MNQLKETKNFVEGNFSATILENGEEGFYKEYYFRLYDHGNPASPIMYFAGEEPESFKELYPKAPRSCSHMFE